MYTLDGKPLLKEVRVFGKNRRILRIGQSVRAVVSFRGNRMVIRGKLIHLHISQSVIDGGNSKETYWSVNNGEIVVLDKIYRKRPKARP